MADLSKARELAAEKKAEARRSIETAKAAAQARKTLKRQPNPQYVDIPPQTGNPEADSAADLNALQAGFKKRASDEARRFALATDTEYWACLCFQTREQKEAFLAAVGIDHLGDKYIDGQAAAKAMGIALPSADVPYNTSSNIDPAWAEFVDQKE